MAERQITFKYGDKRYVVDAKAYDLNRIILPDRRMLEAEGWLESDPPQPQGLYEIYHAFMAMEPEKIASLMNAVVAVEVIKH